MNNQRVNSQDEGGHNVADNQIPVSLSLICRSAGTARICPELIFIVAAIQSWMPSIKLLCPLRVIVEPACLTRWSAHPPWVPQRVVHCFITQDQSLQCSSHPRREEALIQEPVIFRLTDLRLFIDSRPLDLNCPIMLWSVAKSSNTRGDFSGSSWLLFPRRLYSHNKIQKHFKLLL